MVNNAAVAYGARKVETASPAELVLMLYEGAIKFCNIAIGAIEKKDYEKANTNIQKARRIIVELQTTLDHKYKVAEDFDVIYDYIFKTLVRQRCHDRMRGYYGTYSKLYAGTGRIACTKKSGATGSVRAIKAADGTGRSR